MPSVTKINFVIFSISLIWAEQGFVSVLYTLISLCFATNFWNIKHFFCIYSGRISEITILEVLLLSFLFLFMYYYFLVQESSRTINAFSRL